MLKRAGLDYWPFVNISYYDSLDEFFEKNNGEFYYIETYGEKVHSDYDYSHQNQDYYFMFGKESTGLPKELLEANKDHCSADPDDDKCPFIKFIKYGCDSRL